MGDDQAPPIPPQNPESPSAPVPSAKPSFMPHYESDPPTSDRRGLPTWMWVVISILLVIIGIPLLLFAALYVYCLFNPLHISMAALPASADSVLWMIIRESGHA